MTAPADPGLQLDVNEMLTAQANISGQQIGALIRRCAELEAVNAALRRLLAESTNGHAETPKEVGRP